MLYTPLVAGIFQIKTSARERIEALTGLGCKSLPIRWPKSSLRRTLSWRRRLPTDRVWFEYGVAEPAAGSDLQRNNNRLTAWPPQYEGGNMIFAYLIGLFCSGLEPRGID